MVGRAQLRCGAPASWLASDGTGQGRREEGEDDGTYMQETKISGALVKKELKLILPKAKSKIFLFNFSRYTCSLL
jgi:hypothetical protein